MTQEQLDIIIAEHEKWVDNHKTGSYADLHGADLTGLNLRGANLIGANLRGADLSEANLSLAELYTVDFRGANLRGADLSEADIRKANLRGADFRWANLTEADISEASLGGICLEFAISDNIILNRTETFRENAILKDTMIGYKQCREEKVVTLEIPKGAIVFCPEGDMCRTNKAIVKEISEGDMAISVRDKDFIYHVGDKIEIKNFNLNPLVPHASGIHFFKTKKEAKDYLS